MTARQEILAMVASACLALVLVVLIAWCGRPQPVAPPSIRRVPVYLPPTMPPAAEER